MAVPVAESTIEGGEFAAPAPIESMSSLPPCESGDPAIAALVAQMLQTTATLTVIVDEMMRFAASGHAAPDAPPVIDILGRLLCSVLPDLLGDHPRASIECATSVLRDADALMCSELYFVAPEATPPARERRPGTPRARRRR
jgi:hypothetical protein